jgi:hypothetical protein
LSISLGMVLSPFCCALTSKFAWRICAPKRFDFS